MSEDCNRAPVERTVGPKCDCLSICGDDPAVWDGRARFCETRIKEQADRIELNICADVVSNWLISGCQIDDVPVKQITALVNYSKS
jgi:hypothetical protein